MSGSPVVLSAPAKINLWLRLLGKRSDGFHEVETRMCPISIADQVTVAPRADGKVRLTCSDPTVPTDESNLALKALRAYEARVGHQRGWDIHLEKNIPHGAGLGGGSSDAAAVFEAVNQFSESPLTLEDLASVAGQIGSDVPFFLHRRACDASGRGEIIIPVTEFPWELSLVLIKPPFGIPTAWAYREWATSQKLQGVLYAAQGCLWGDMVNDLERAVFQKYTLLPTLKMWLLDQEETTAALMSGSGSTVYAIAKSGIAAETLAQKARQLCGPDTWIQVAQTL